MSDVKIVLGVIGTAVVGIGAGVLLSGGNPLSSVDNLGSTPDSSMTDVPVYMHGVADSGVSGTSLDDEGKKEKKEYELTLPMSSINGTSSTLQVTINASQFYGDGDNIPTEDLVNRRFGLGFTGDIELDAGDDEVKLIDFSDSTINGEEDYTNVAFLGSDSETITYSIPINPDSDDVYAIDDLEKSDDEYEVILTTGFSTNLKLIFENDS